MGDPPLFQEHVSATLQDTPEQVIEGASHLSSSFDSKLSALTAAEQIDTPPVKSFRSESGSDNGSQDSLGDTPLSARGECVIEDILRHMSNDLDKPSLEPESPVEDLDSKH